MSSIKEVDKNFTETGFPEGVEFEWYSVEEEPFRLCGVFREGDRFCRIPKKLAENTNPGVNALYAQGAGGRVRFSTDSQYIAVSASLDTIAKISNFALIGSAGFDIYEKIPSREMYLKTFSPPYEVMEGYKAFVDLGSERERSLTMNFPLYSDVKTLYVGIVKGSKLKTAPEYTIEKPVVYYGSSITQGGCASKPGSSYQSIISQTIDCNYINLGFSGNAMGESCMAEYIADMDMSMFVLDYDHNAPTEEHLKKTHEPFFKIIRDKNPDLPILIMSRPIYNLKEFERQRYEIIRQTYANAYNSGDKNVYFLSGPELMADVLENGLVDGCHPSDSGFFSMAKAIIPVMKEALGL